MKQHAPNVAKQVGVILDGTLTLLEKLGWTQRQTKSMHGCHCLSAALIESSIGPEGHLQDAYFPASDLVASVIKERGFKPSPHGGDNSICIIVDWNDRDGRKFEQVKEVLLAARGRV